MNYIVYLHTNIIDGKRYVGITSQKAHDRWKNGLGYSHNEYFTRAINKYGWDNFKHEILFIDLTKEEAEQKEIELIELYKSNQRRYGYNISNGGECIGKHSEESKLKMSTTRKGRIALNKGIPMTKEQKLKMRELNQHKAKKVVKVDLKGNVLQEYVSINETARCENLDKAVIYRTCHGKQKTTNGYIFMFKDDYKENIEMRLKEVNETIENRKKTMFKKGQVAWNKKVV